MDDAKIKEIKNSVDIVEIISEYVPLTSKGKNFFGVCPFHQDHSPSMSVSKEKQIYTCFSCGASGNVFTFLMDYENISFKEALKKLADRAGVDFALNNDKTINKNQVLYDIFDFAQKIYQNNLNSEVGLKAKEYLKDRNITQEIMKEFGIGLSIKDNKLITNLLLKKGFKENDLIKTGLVGLSDTNLHDIYYNRIMFPLWDLNGNIVGYSGRIYDMKDTSKYINTKETDIFKKGEILYNYHKARDEARKKNKVIVMEGFMDVIAAYKVGIKNVVATMGTAVTSNHATLLKRMAKDIILCFDGDEAGAKATFSCIEELMKIGVTPKIIRLEDNLDPDEYVNKYGNRFLDKLENPISAMDFKLNYLKKDLNLTDQAEYSKYIESALKEIIKTDDIILKELTLQKLSEESKIKLDILKEKLENMNEPKKKIIPKDNFVKKNVSAPLKAEQALMYYLINNKEVSIIYKNNQVFLQTDRYRSLATNVVALSSKGDYNASDLLIEFNNQKDKIDTIKEILSFNFKDDYTLDDIIGYIKTIKLYNLKKEQSRLNQLLENTIDKQEKDNIMKKIIDVIKEEQEIKKEGYYGK